MAKKPTEPEATDAPAPRLLFDLPPLTERLDFPEPYTGHWAEVRLDLADYELAGEQVLKIAILAKVVTAWSLKQADGTPAPLTLEGMAALWDQATPLFLWLYEEWQARRLRPLVAKPTPLSLNSSPRLTT